MKRIIVIGDVHGYFEARTPRRQRPGSSRLQGERIVGMKFSRLLLAAIYLLTVPTGSLWSEMEESIVSRGAVSHGIVGIQVLKLSNWQLADRPLPLTLNEGSQTSNPSLLKFPPYLARTIETASRHLIDLTSDRGGYINPVASPAIPALEETGRTAQRITTSPGSGELDHRRADFTVPDGPAVTGSEVPATAPIEEPSAPSTRGLAPSQVHGMPGRQRFSQLEWEDFQERPHKIVIPVLKEGAVLLVAAGVAASATIGGVWAYVWMLPTILLFALTNMAARISVQAEFNARLPADQAAGLSAFSRTGVKVAAMIVKYLPSLATLAAATPARSFWIMGGALATFAGAQLLSIHATPAPPLAIAQRTENHGAPNPFHRDPGEDRRRFSREFMRDILDPEEGEEFFYRMARSAMNERFAQFPISEGMPEAVLHGNPIVENVKRKHGAVWVEDFDNAGFNGKYGQDIVRFLCSMSYFGFDFTGHEAVRHFKKGYLRGFDNPDKGFPGMEDLAAGKIKGGSTTDYYLEKRKKILEMRKHPLPTNDPRMKRLLRLYLKSSGRQRLLETHDIEEAGKTSGTTEQWDSAIVLLKPKAGEGDRVLLVIKAPLRPNRSDRFGERVVRAARLFAPGSLLSPGYFTYRGKYYYGYQVSTLKGKVKGILHPHEIDEIAFGIGAELGRAAKLSQKDSATAKNLRDHFSEHFDELVAAAALMRREIDDAYNRYRQDAEKARIASLGQDSHD